MKFLVAVDLEGANFVVGKPYEGLSPDAAEYATAVRETTAELNAVLAGLYDGGAEKVYVWDNHGTGHNLDFAAVDPRATNAGLDASSLERMNFADGLGLDGVIFLGYHAKEGTLGGVLAHTYSSASRQYYKLDGKQVGEFYIDSTIALCKHIPVRMLVGDDHCVQEAKEIGENVVTVVTKYGEGRNAARFRDNDELLAELYAAAQKAMRLPPVCLAPVFPKRLEIRYTRTELAAEVKERVLRDYGVHADYGEDAHILQLTARRIEDIKVFL